MKSLIATKITLLLLLIFISPAQAATHLYRLSWDGNPQHEAVIGFSADALSINPYVIYGLDTNSDAWQQALVTAEASFFGLQSYFVRLDSLPADSNIYFQVCDQDGCGQRMWFKTAADYAKPFTAIAGGDTRTGWTTRQDGNRLVAKLRPLFIMHGGDFTNGNTPIEMTGFLQDWQLTFSSDSINGIDYKRIYPIIPTHGNHEDTNYATLCQVFGVDYVRDGLCNEQDAYGAMTINELMRVYTLNSQYQESGWSTFATQMNLWLSDDLLANKNAPLWRVAQYHKPIFPHYDGKPSNEGLFSWWAKQFYDLNMNLVVESDTHINKLTHPLKPADTGTAFLQADEGGTVYVGEGSWGAPARSANQSFPWTIDLASIQQFKVFSVTPEKVFIRTAQFDDSANTLSFSARQQDPLALPDNVAWWSANGVGEVYTLVQTNSGLSQRDLQLNANQREFTLSVTDDGFISSNRPTMNYNGYADGMKVGLNDTSYGETRALIQFEPNMVGTCATLTEANLSFTVLPTDSAAESALAAVSEVGVSTELGVALNLELISPQFNENTLNWHTGNALFSDNIITGFETLSSGKNITLTFNQTTLAKLNAQFQQHQRFGFGISASHPAVTRIVSDRENTQPPTLRTRFTASTACFESPANSVSAPSEHTNLNASKGNFHTFTILPEANQRKLMISLNNGFGDADLYVAMDSTASLSNYLCRPYTQGNSEDCELDVPADTAVSIGLHAHASYSGVTLSISKD